MERLRLVCAGDPVSATQTEGVRALLESRQKSPAFVEAVSLDPARSEDSVGPLTRNLLTGRADFACSPVERLPARLPRGIAVGAWLRDSSRLLRCVSPHAPWLSLLPARAKVVTADAVARAQILHRHPRLEVELAPERAGLLTGLRQDRWQAACVSPALLEAEWTAALHVETIESDEVIPAVGLGAIAVLIRSSDPQNRERAARINEPTTAHLLRAERSFIRHLPRMFGVLATARAVRAGDLLKLTGLIVERNGAWLALDEAEAPVRFGDVIAQDVASACADLAGELRILSPSPHRVAS